MYQKSSDEHKEIQAKARYSRETLMLVKEIFRQLTQDSHFCELLNKNNITDMPEILSPAR